MPRDRAFEEDLPICWYLYRDGRTNTCRVEDFLVKRPAHDRLKVIARMREWAKLGNWNVRVGFVKRLELPASSGDVVLYEVKSFQDRILFLRVGNDAVAIDATQKKDDWSKKDKKFLEAAVKVARAALFE